MIFQQASVVEETREWLRTPEARQTHFRSARLRPAAELLGDPLGYAMKLGDQQLVARVDELRRIRASLLIRGVAAPAALTIDESGGRLLVSSILESVVDGASAASSNGWFDAADLPPWDTWLCYGLVFPARRPHADALISYVPTEYLQDVQRGIDVNPVDCHAWASDVDGARLEGLLFA